MKPSNPGSLRAVLRSFSWPRVLHRKQVLTVKDMGTVPTHLAPEGPVSILLAYLTSLN